MSLLEVLDSHRVVVCVGSGGVGKTTTAASLAVASALRGKRVLCLTIDPAKRLANSLGLETMKTEEQVISHTRFEAAGLDCKGSLSAMMLDTKHTFDELVSRYAPDAERRERILSNKLYQYVSTSLAGTQEYMAMEKLYAVKDDPRFDLILLDTPPTSNALDFLQAPERMVDFVDSPAVRWFLEAFSGAGRKSWNILGKGASLLLKGLSQFTGSEFLDELAAFLVDFNSLFGGFRERAGRVSAAFRSQEVAFLIVTSPAPLAIEESLFFGQKLEQANMSSKAFIINQVHALHPEPAASDEAIGALLAPLMPTLDATKVAEKLLQALDDERQRAIGDRIEIERLHSRIKAGAHFIEVPAFDRDVHDLAALAHVSEYLIGERAMPMVVRS